MAKRIIILVLIICLSGQIMFAGITEYSYFNRYSKLRTEELEPIQFVRNEVTETAQQMQSKNKSRILAFLIASVPGFFIHGLGHKYIGKEKIYKRLLRAEIFSFILLWGGGYVYNAGVRRYEEDKRRGYDLSLAIAEIMFLSGLSLFLGAWIYDIIGIFFASKELNENKTKNISTKIFLNSQYSNIYCNSFGIELLKFKF